MSRILNRDDTLRIRLGGRQGPGPTIQRPSFRHPTTAPKTVGTVIVKVGYMPASRANGYAQYIERDGTAGPATRDGTTAAQGYSGYIGREGAGEGGQRAELFTSAGQAVDREAFVERSVNDPRAWWVIVSPGNDLDMTRYVRELMAQAEIDLGKRFDWCAATHRNTPYVHSHILLRGKDRDGRSFRIDRDYIKAGMRTRATEIARLFRELGYVRESPMMAHARPLWRSMEAWIRSHAREGHGRG